MTLVKIRFFLRQEISFDKVALVFDFIQQHLPPEIRGQRESTSFQAYFHHGHCEASAHSALSSKLSETQNNK